MAITRKKAHREEGLIFLSPRDVEDRGTHVLIVGCDKFHRDSGLESLTSPGRTARALACWFLAGGGFDNPRQPLASLSLLLSENDVDSLSEIEDGPVPRATFASVRTAVERLRARSEANEGNLMFLYFASHGIGHEDRTGLIFEDYGTDKDNWLAGMTDTDQLVRALRRVKVKDKIAIFDCCRNEVRGIDSRDYLGQPLINPAPVTPLPAPAIALRSTFSGSGSYGFEDGLTLFGDALLKALGGLAARPSERWTVDTASLKWVTSKLLELRKSKDKGMTIQIPDADHPGEFIICQSKPTDRVAVYLSVAPPHSQAAWRLTVSGADGTATEAKPEWIGAAHVKLDLPDRAEVQLRLVDAADETIDEVTESFVAPVAFPDLPSDFNAPVVERARGFQSPDKNPSLVVHGNANIHVEQITLSGARFWPPHQPRTIGISSGGRTELLPGHYGVLVTRLDGRRSATDVELAQGEALVVNVPGPGSPHEFLIGPAEAGVLPPNAKGDYGTPDAEPLFHFRLGKGSLPLDDWNEGLLPAQANLIRTGANPRFQVFSVEDKASIRFPPRAPASLPSAYPIWVEVRGDDWREIAVLPTLGSSGWWARMLIDADSSPRSRLAPYVLDPDWMTLLAFLGHRDFPEAKSSLEQLYKSRALHKAVFGKRHNPLAAVAGLLAAVAVGPVEEAGIPPSWLENLTNWFVGLPDGPVALGRFHERQGDIERARDSYRLALSRGVPVFSLAVDWLAEGLEALGEPGAAEALRWSRLCDSLRTFTVLRMESD